MSEQIFLPGLPCELIRRAYLTAPGNEIESGKFASPESSAALVANAFGLYLDRPTILPPLPCTSILGWPAGSVGLETILRFPWTGGRHPCLDVLIETSSALIGIESKRFEPFRSKVQGQLSDAYWRPVWGDRMGGYERMRDGLRAGRFQFVHLDTAQLVKHAFGLRTAVHAYGREGKHPVLFYLYAEPETWPDGRLIARSDLERHREEISIFASAVEGNEVEFISCCYRDLLVTWFESPSEIVRRHALAVAKRFNV